MKFTTKRIVDISEFVRNGASIKQDDSASGLKITRIETISNRVVDLDKCGYANLSDNDFKEYRLKSGDILISHINSEKHLGKCAIFDMPRNDIVHGMNLLALRTKEIADCRYVYHYLNSKKFLSQIPKITKKSVNQASFTVTAFKELEIPLPPLKEQKRIAAILDKADAIRQKRQKAIELADEFLRSVFLDMFGDPVTNPKGWDVYKFNDVGALDRGKSKHRPRNDPKLLNGKYPLIQTGDVANAGGYITEFTSTYSEFGLSQSKMWPIGTLCITIAANIAKTGILTFDACFPDSVVGFTPNQLVTVEYIQYWLSFLQKMLEETAPESAQKNINLAILRSLDLPIPPIQTQQKFSEIVNTVRDIKNKINETEKNYFTMFNGLSKKAFSGEL